MKLNKLIYVIHCGGTIGMIKTRNGYAPKSCYLLNKIKSIILSSSREDIPNFYFNEYENLIDSSNITTKDWIKIALDIIENYDNYDGFVVLHGTDTLAYTSSALSFILGKISKPVICTGSYIPISEPNSDAINNIIHSFVLAANKNISEVCLFFNKKLMRGNRVLKFNASSPDSFISPNYPLLCEFLPDLVLNKKNILPKGKLNKNNHFFKLTDVSPPKIALLNIFPGFDSSFLSCLIDRSFDALIIKTYGVGNIFNSSKIIGLLAEISRRDIVILNCSQCSKGSIAHNIYAASCNITNIGIISGYDMTDEAAFTKLFYLLTLYRRSINKVKNNLIKNLRGELTLI